VKRPGRIILLDNFGLPIIGDPSLAPQHCLYEAKQPELKNPGDSGLRVLYEPDVFFWQRPGEPSVWRRLLGAEKVSTVHVSYAKLVNQFNEPLSYYKLDVILKPADSLSLRIGDRHMPTDGGDVSIFPMPELDPGLRKGKKSL
jgi:hypothetical protein